MSATQSVFYTFRNDFCLIVFKGFDKFSRILRRDKMSYSYSKQFGVQSYMSGVNYSDWMKEALNPENKSAENERLSITSSQEDYFKKQRLIQEAIAQLQSRGSVSSEIAKEIDVESLKKSLKDAENG